MKKVISLLKFIWPYALILMFSLAGCYLLFYGGLNTGDDFNFHMPNILDEYKTLISDYRLSPISGTLINGLGLGNRLFYSPLPHLTVALMMIVVDIFNGSMIVAYKIVLVTSVFVSGVFMYHFGLHISKNNKIVALIAASIYVLYPYRLFDAFCRLAFAEAFSFIFLPLFFMGLYDITHFKDKVRVVPFLEVIYGGALLYLSHNLTAFYGFVFGIIYLVCHAIVIAKSFKLKNYALYCGLSVFFLLGIASIAFVSQFELMGSKIYNISNSERMWTTVDQVVKRTAEQFDYSGFLNIPFLTARYPDILSKGSLITDIILYIIIAACFIIVDLALANVSKLKYFHTLISSSLLLSCVLLFANRVECYLGYAIFYLLYIFFCFMRSKKDDKLESDDKIYKNITFWYCILMIVCILFAMQDGSIWTTLPSIFLNIQFPWRLWAYVQLFAALLIALICTYYSPKKIAQSIFIIAVGLLMVANQPLIEKRMLHETNVAQNKVDRWYNVLDDSILDTSTAMGFNREYCPQIFLDNEYISEYSNSLYYGIRNRFRYGFGNYEDYYYKPIVLSGNGTVQVSEAYAPFYTMEVEVTESSIIQMPLLYYPGYEVTITDEDGNKNVITPYQIDYLVTFNLSSGKYVITTDYVGTSARQVSFIWFSVSISGSIAMLALSLIIKKRKEKVDNDFENVIKEQV